MTTAPTPEEVRALAERLEHCVAKWGKQNALSLEAYSAVKMMRRLQASYQALQTENERLRMELVAEASAAAELEARKPLPLSDEQVDDLHGEANRGFDMGREEYFKAFRDAERAHGIKET